MTSLIETIRELNEQFRQGRPRSSEYVRIEVRIPVEMAHALDQLKILEKKGKGEIVELALELLFSNIKNLR